MNDSIVAAFLLGAAAGAATTWTFAVARERFRRIRRDIRTARKGLKTLRIMFRRELGTLITTGAVVALAIVGAVALVATR